MIFDFLKKGDAIEVPETKASKAGPVIAYASSGRVAWSPRDTSSLIKQAFQSNPVGFRVVRMIAEAAAALPLVVQDEGARYDTHPVLSLIRRPNGAQGRAEVFEALYTQLLLTGNGYLEGVMDEDGAPVELHVLRSDRMAVVPGADGWPVAYEYAVGGKKHRFPVVGGNSPICHVKAYHPGDDHYGLSPLQAAARAVDVHNSASAWSKALLDNAARPSGAIVYRGEGQSTLSPEQYDRLIGELEAHHQGARNAGRPMLLEGGLDWRPMGFSPADMEFQKTKESAAREVALAFGVPPMLLGLPGDAAYANYQEANRAFFRLTVLPLAERVTGCVSNWLGAAMGTDAVLRPDLDQVPALATEREAQWRRVMAADFLSAGEKRSLLGLPKGEE